MPFNFKLFFSLFTRSFREASPRRKKVLRFLVIVLPIVIVFNQICLLLDYILFPAFWLVKVKKPVFIIGHARSGTSLLHRLLAGDTDNFSWVKMYELVLPSIIQRKLVRLIAVVDARFFNSRLATRVHAWEDRVFAKGRQMHPMNLDGPEEDEFLLTLSFYSGTVAMIFPYISELADCSDFDNGNLSDAKKRRVMRFYKRCVQRTLYMNGSNKIHLSKNPMFSAKVVALRETFPDARFLVVMRNPYETIPSILKMMSRNWKASDCSRELIAESLKSMGEQSLTQYLHPWNELKASDNDWLAVRYEELIDRPLDIVSSVYSSFDIEMGEAERESLLKEQQKNKSYRAEHIYSLEEFGLTYQEIRSSLEPLFEKYQWQIPHNPEIESKAEVQSAG